MGGFLTENNLYLLLFGIYLIYLFIDTKFKGYIFIAMLVISIPLLGFIHTKLLRQLIFILLFGVAFIGALVEVDKFKKLGKDIYRPTARNIIVALVLCAAYIASKLLLIR